MIRCKKHTNNLVRMRQEYLTRQGKIRLGMNEYIPFMPKALFRKIMKGFSIEMASAYPETNRAYDALSQYLGQQRDRINLSSGADSAIKMIFETFCESGDSVSTITPTFAMYKVHAQLLNCKLKEVCCDNDGECSYENLLKLASPGIRLVILANPNGITGHAFTVRELRGLVKKAKAMDILIVIDETYANFGDIDASPLIDEFSNVIIVRSLSKNIGMAGLRIGYTLTSKRLSAMIEKFKPMMEINALAARAVEEVYSNRNYIDNSVKKIKRSRKKFADDLRKLGFDVVARSGNFVLVDFGLHRNSIVESMIYNNVEFKVLPSPLKRYIRLTIGLTCIMDKVVNIIKSGIN